jgi:hypothetical protein
MNSKERRVCAELGWSLCEFGKDVDVMQFSPAGEDFFFTVSRTNFAEEVRQYAEDFDPDEHATMWVENRNRVRGVPQSIRELINDADAIKAMLVKLGDELMKTKE